MEVNSTSKLCLLLGNDILDDDNLFVFLEALDFKIKTMTVMPEQVRIYIDSSIHRELRNLEKNKQRSEYMRIKGIISILQSLHLYEDIDPSEIRDFKPFFQLKKEKEDYELVFLTGNKTYASKCNVEKKDTDISIVKFNDIALVHWEFDSKGKTIKEAIEFKNAFFTTEKDQLISVENTLEFDYVYSPKYGYLQLEKDNVMFGGEGKIYRTYENFLVKIYAIEERRYETMKKIQLLIDLDLRHKYIVWPKDIVYNGNEFVGYVMEEIADAKGLDMYRIYSFLNLSYQDRFDICIKLLKMIDYLHKRNILIGDLKFDNVMYKPRTKELFIIDSGSFQLEDYACGVFNAAYTHNNLKGINLRQILRTLEEEYFPINKILFEVLMGKGPFYDFKSGEVGSEIERDFHYPMEYKEQITNQQNPLFYWVHSDERLRYAFYDYFKKGIITDVEQWIKLLEEILNKGAE
jgi:serine/threonine protein kinase